jgi:DNA-binding MarR family transcriptional regulator
MAQSVGRSRSAGYDSDLVGLAEARAAIARNCKRFAHEPAASAAAADIIITLRRTATAIQSVMESYARAYDLSPSKIIIIMALASAQNQRLAQSDIARQLAVSMGSLTALITSLESSGLVKRTIAPDDRRVFRIALTAKGNALVKRFAPVHYRNEAAAVSVLSPKEQRTLLSLLDKLRGHLLAEEGQSPTRRAAGVAPSADREDVVLRDLRGGASKGRQKALDPRVG